MGQQTSNGTYGCAGRSQVSLDGAVLHVDDHVAEGHKLGIEGAQLFVLPGGCLRPWRQLEVQRDSGELVLYLEFAPPVSQPESVKPPPFA
jgi:hypothetical protein